MLSLLSAVTRSTPETAAKASAESAASAAVAVPTAEQRAALAERYKARELSVIDVSEAQLDVPVPWP